MTASEYTPEAFRAIVQGYRMLDKGGRLSALFKDVSQCNECSVQYQKRSDHPVNLLVRPLPLQKLQDKTAVDKYFTRIKRDHGFLQNLLDAHLSPAAFRKRVVSERFCIGLLPWLDYSMLHRRSSRTDLMVVGIDFKHFPGFLKNEKDHHLPLSTPESPSNIWGPTWRGFWRNLLGKGADDAVIQDFLEEHAAYFTNSMLCFGGSEDPTAHSWEYIACCRPYIEQQIEIVKPKCLVSFGNLGCWNVANILKDHNPDCRALDVLSRTRSPLSKWRALSCKDQKSLHHLSIGSHELAFFPHYQPARAHALKHKIDYRPLRDCLHM
jgi:hypothetical protein